MSLYIQNLTTIYPKTKEKAIDQLTLKVEQGQFVGILGRSGAGKSTLIRCMNKLVHSTSGEVIWNGEVINRLTGKKLRNIRRDIGMIFQQFHLIPRLTVLQNAVLGCFGYRPAWKNLVGLISKDEKERALQALSRVDLLHLAHKRVDQLSGGQQQRVAIARVIMQQPKMLLGDEPVASLDPVTSKQVMELIKEIHDTERMTTVMNLHDVQIALQYCDRIIGLFKGRLVFDGKPHEVTEEVLSHIYQ